MHADAMSENDQTDKSKGDKKEKPDITVPDDFTSNKKAHVELISCPECKSLFYSHETYIQHLHTHHA